MTAGLSPADVLALAVRPALAFLGLPGGEPAVRLVLGTAAVESGFAALRQAGGGPAVSLWQVEPSTARDAIERCPAVLRQRIFHATAMWPWPEPGGPTSEAVIAQLPTNLFLGAAMCRLVYYMKPFSVASLGDGSAELLAHTWKIYYNSSSGAGSEAKFLKAWATSCEGLFR